MREGVLDVWAVQFAPHWNNPEQSYARIEQLLQPLVDSRQNCDLLVLPEMFATGFSLDFESSEVDEGPSVQWMKQLAVQLDAVVVGTVKVKVDEHLVNRLYWIDANTQVQKYDKVHLFGGEKKHFKAGSKRLITQLNGFKLFLQTCYDLRFPVFCRNQRQEYDVLINVSSWPKPRIAHWNALLKARAIENQCFCIAVNRIGEDGNNWEFVGESQILGPSGDFLATSDLEQEQVITAKLEKDKLNEYRNTYRFLQDADCFRLSSIDGDG